MRSANARACALVRAGLVGVAVALLQACATSTQVTPLQASLASRPGPCSVQVLPRGAALPEGLAPIARIESHIQRNVFLGGRVTLIDEAYKELRVKACELGGDFVHLDDYMESQAAEMTHVHVWATAYRQK